MDDYRHFASAMAQAKTALEGSVPTILQFSNDRRCLRDEGNRTSGHVALLSQASAMSLAPAESPCFDKQHSKRCPQPACPLNAIHFHPRQHARCVVQDRSNQN